MNYFFISLSFFFSPSFVISKLDVIFFFPLPFLSLPFFTGLDADLTDVHYGASIPLAKVGRRDKVERERVSEFFRLSLALFLLLLSCPQAINPVGDVLLAYQMVWEREWEERLMF